jgi:CYTH domain-containing protein
MKKEIEKKFLLKDLPILPSGCEIQHIVQYYYLVDGTWYRIRKINSNFDEEKPIFLHTIKTYKDDICYEQEKFYSNEEYMALVKEIHSGKYETSCLTKTRYIYKTGVMADFEGEIKEIKWEIDVFNFSLVVAELELPDMSFKIEMPNFIKKKLILEVTGIKEFSNRFLSEPLKISKITKDVTI